MNRLTAEDLPALLLTGVSAVTVTTGARLLRGQNPILMLTLGVGGGCATRWHRVLGGTAAAAPAARRCRSRPGTPSTGGSPSVVRDAGRSRERPRRNRPRVSRARRHPRECRARARRRAAAARLSAV